MWKFLEKLKRKKSYSAFQSSRINAEDVIFRTSLEEENRIMVRPSRRDVTYPIIDDPDGIPFVKDTRIVKKPIEVWEELMISEKPSIDWDSIDEAIKETTQRKKCMERVGGNVNDENNALRYLNNRKKYKKHTQDTFLWHITTEEKVKNLCEKYACCSVSFGSFSRNIPNEAIKEIEQAEKDYKTCGIKEEPILRLIIDDSNDSHKKGEFKKDPILLMASPFGRWHYILGAWDKEVQYVDDLIYHGK